MATQPLPGPADHADLRAALEFAVGVAEAGQRLRPPLGYPPELKQFFRLDRLPAGALGRVRRIVEADPAFRERLAGAVAPELVDDIGREWLQRDDGWEERVAALVEAADAARADDDASSQLRRAERRRAAAEQTALRTRAELLVSRDRIAELERELGDHRRAHHGATTEAATVRDELTAARLAVRHANDRAESARAKLAAIEHERDDARRRADEAEQQRDALLAARAEASGAAAGAGAGGITEVRALAASARALADRLQGLVAVPAPPRRAVALRGAIAHSPRASAEHLLRVAGALVLVDGYNVAKLGWPALDLADQRERTLDAADDLARRFGTEMAVVFDGSDVIGAHSARRRLVRVRYSPAGVTADDVIRAEVGAAPTSRAVVVVTNDGAVRRDVAAAGANTVSSDAFLDVALR